MTPQTARLPQNRLAAAIVIHDGRVLLVRRSRTERFLPGIWAIPCGKLNPGEDPAVGALRELKEETGIVGRVRRLAGHSEFVSEWDGRMVHSRQANFVVEPLTSTVTLEEPDQDYQWVPIDELGDADLDAYNLDAIKQAL